MFATPEELRQSTSELTTSIWTAAAVGALFERRDLAEALREPRTLAELLAAIQKPPSDERLERCLEVGVAAGVIVKDGAKYSLAPGGMPFAQEPMRRSLAGDLRTHLQQALAYLDRMTGRADAPAGWYHDASTLQSQGDASMMLAPMIKMRLAPQLGDLSARLEKPKARFLDVGVGVGSLAIAMARMFPELEIVGLDVFDGALAVARANVDKEKLADRIELRKVPVSDLRDERPFTLAWLPLFFIRDIDSALARIHAALEPGGFVFCGCGGAGGTPLKRAVWGVIQREWAGAPVTPPDVEAALTKAGFVDVKTMPGPEWAPCMVVGRRG